MQSVAPGDPVVRVAVPDEVRTSQPRRCSASASARLLSRFSSAVPQVIVVGTGGTKPVRPWTCPTKRVMRAKREKFPS